MKRFFKINVFVLIFTLLFSSVVYAEDTDTPIFYAICRAKDYTWYAEDGVFSVAVCQHGAKNDIDQWSFWVFSKNDTTKQVKTVTNSSENIQNIELGLSTIGQKLIEDYGWTQEEATFLSTNFTYRGSSSIRYNIGDEPTLYGYQSDAYLDYPDTNSKVLADFVNDLKGYFFDEDSWDDDGYNPDDGYLPMLTFSIDQAFVTADIGGSVKYTWKWSVSEHEIYANNPNKYKLQMVASASLREETTLGLTRVYSDDIGYINNDCRDDLDDNIPIYQESYSFLDRNRIKKLCEIKGYNYLDWGANAYYYIFVRVIEPGTENCSLWKSYKCNGRIVTPTGYTYDENGNAQSYNDNTQIDDDANYDSDPSTDAGNSETSSDYTEKTNVSATALLNNLKEIISTLGDLPELFQKVFLWMPPYLIALIVAGIAAIVVVGFIKLFR